MRVTRPASASRVVRCPSRLTSCAVCSTELKAQQCHGDVFKTTQRNMATWQCYQPNQPLFTTPRPSKCSLGLPLSVSGVGRRGLRGVAPRCSVRRPARRRRDRRAAPPCLAAVITIHVYSAALGVSVFACRQLAAAAAAVSIRVERTRIHSTLVSVVPARAGRAGGAWVSGLPAGVQPTSQPASPPRPAIVTVAVSYCKCCSV